MANKKFYYRNKSKAAAKNRMEVQQKALENYTEAQLSKTLEQLGVSEASANLLRENGIVSAAELVVRSEKDMYKIQGLNKRILGEVKTALSNAGMSLYVDPDAPAQPAQREGASQNGAANGKKQQDKSPASDKKAEQTKSDKRGKNRSDEQKRPDEQRAPKFGLADRKEPSSKQPQASQQKSARSREKITEPLPPELWRKILKGGKWGFSDGFKTVIPPMYDEIFSFKEGLASVEIDGKCGYIDSENNVVIPLEYDLAMSFSEGLAMVARGEKCGYINKNNEVVIDFAYDAASPFEDGEAKVKKDGRWATLTPDGKLTLI